MTTTASAHVAGAGSLRLAKYLRAVPLFKKRPPSPSPPPQIPVDPFAGDRDVKALFDSLQAGDWAGADRAYTALETTERREFALSLIPWDLRGGPDTVDRWVEAEPNSVTAHLLRGVHGIGFAWKARGSGWASTVGADAWPTFFECLRIAEHELGLAASLAPDDPLPWVFLEITARGLEYDIEERCARFDEVQKRNPQLLFAHHEMLQNLCAKWSGSDDMMFGFARQITASSLDGSPLPSLVPMAHFEHWISEGRPDGYMRSASPEIVAAAQRSVPSPDLRR